MELTEVARQTYRDKFNTAREKLLLEKEQKLKSEGDVTVLDETIQNGQSVMECLTRSTAEVEVEEKQAVEIKEEEEDRTKKKESNLVTELTIENI